jgi:hypothetical protein
MIAVAPQQPESSAEARKRRREILALQRSVSVSPSDLALSPIEPIPVVSAAEVPCKRRKVEQTKDGKPAKKPQMKYDPDVPMTKEEATVWRREQRRKRNRESAAASRQRQRDRIVELEIEVEGWQTKFDDIMAKITKLEKLAAEKNLTVPPQSELLISIPKGVSKLVSPPSSPGHSTYADSPQASPVASSVSALVDSSQVSKERIANQLMEEAGKHSQHSDKMISRQAVS